MTNNLKATVIGTVGFLGLIAKSVFNIDIPANILTDFEAVIIFALGYITNKPDKTEAKNEKTINDSK
ncbi:MAG: hypothetical protein QXV17_07550 [Candidatus Micrarchaeaceae archaeon]